jgi:hypothetical protein
VGDVSSVIPLLHPPDGAIFEPLQPIISLYSAFQVAERALASLTGRAPRVVRVWTIVPRDWADNLPVDNQLEVAAHSL